MSPPGSLTFCRLNHNLLPHEGASICPAKNLIIMQENPSRAITSALPANNPDGAAWVRIADYDANNGWGDAAKSATRSRWCCEQLEEGQILFFDGIPYDFPEADRQFLLQQRQGDSRIHKNISYRPTQDVLRGSASDSREDIERLHGIMRHFSEEIVKLLTQIGRAS